jgi:hypothetical protein
MVRPPFRTVFSAPVLFRKTLPGFAPALQRLVPTKKAVPTPSLPGELTRGRALMLSWAFRPLRLSPPLTCAVSLSLTTLPSRSWKMAASRQLPSRTTGSSGLGVSAFSLAGRRPIWPFPPTSSATSLRDKPLADYFFVSENHDPLRDPRFRLCKRLSPA